MDDIFSFAGGMLFGLLSGLIPGLHPNTVIAILSSLGLDDRGLALMIISLYPAHLMASFIPAIFFGIPERSLVAAVLPGQRMVLEGQGLAALKTALLSCLLAALLSVALFHLSLGLFPLIYAAIKGYIGYLLLAFTLILLAKSRKPHLAILIFLASGFLGQYALGTRTQDPFLPLFSGMFAMGAIANYSKSRVPGQKDVSIGFGFAGFALLGVILGFLADLLPGVGAPSQIAALATIALPFNTLGYLSAVSSISVSEAVFSLSTQASMDKSRMGATEWLAGYMPVDENLMLLLALFVLSMAVSAFIIYLLRSKAARLASLDFSRFNIILAAYLAGITLLLDGAGGLLILCLATALGWVTVKLEVERTNLMGAIILPTLLLLFRIFF